MSADILRQGRMDEGEFNPSDEAGEWVSQQDPDFGEIIRVWQPNTQDDPDTPDVNESATLETFPCIARGIIDGGIRVAGTTERIGELYEAVDYVRIQFPANVKISRRDQVTNIRDVEGNIIWREEERDDRAPTIFSVNGVIPIPDPFGRLQEYSVLLERVETQ